MAQQLRVHAFSISLDGFGAGRDQSLDDPIGARGQELHEWLLPTQALQQHFDPDSGEGSTGLDNDFAARGFEGIGATIMGRNMFGPVRGDWPDESWTGWWGDRPGFEHPVFVLTHHARDPIAFDNGTTFHFVTDGPQAALERALEAANGLDVRLGGGASTLRQYFGAGLVDYAHLAIVPVVLGEGERLFEGLHGIASGYTCSFTPSDTVVHAELVRV